MALLTLAIGRAAQFLLALATLRAATTWLSPEEMGRVSLTLTSLAFFAMLLINPVGMFINRRLHGWHAHGRAKAYLRLYPLYLGLVALVTTVVLSLLAQTEMINFGMPMGWLIVLVSASLIFNTINQTTIPSLNLLGDAHSFVVMTVATLAASFLCAVALVHWIRPSAEYWILGLLLGQTFLAFIGARKLFNKLGGEQPTTVTLLLKHQQLKMLLEFAWPVSFAASLVWVQSQGYRYIMEDELGFASVGLFVAGYGLSAGLIAGFESVLTAYFQPRLYRDVNAGQPEQQALVWRRYATAVIPSLLLTVSMLAVLAPELTRLFLGEKFQSAAEFVVWGALAETARVLAGVYSLIAHIYMRTRWLILPNLMGAVLSVGLCLALMPILGATGAGVGLVVSGFVMVGTMHQVFIRKVGASPSLHLTLRVVVAVVCLWMVAWALRYLVPMNNWLGVLLTLGVTGICFLFLQYAFLRSHLPYLLRAR